MAINNADLLAFFPRSANSGRKAQIRAEAYARAEGRTIGQLDPESRKEFLNRYAAAQAINIMFEMYRIQEMLNNLAWQNIIIKRDSLRNLPQTQGLPADHPILRALRSASEDLSFIKLMKALLDNIVALLNRYTGLINEYTKNYTLYLALGSDQPQKVFAEFHAQFLNILERNNSDSFFDQNGLAFLSGSIGLNAYLRGTKKPSEYTPSAETTPYAEVLGARALPHPNTKAIYEKLLEKYPYDSSLGVSKEAYVGFVARMAEIFANRGFTASDMDQKNAATDAAKQFCRPSAGVWRDVQAAYEVAIKQLEAIKKLHEKTANELNKNAEELTQCRTNLQRDLANGEALLRMNVPASQEGEDLQSTLYTARTEIDRPLPGVTPSAQDYIDVAEPRELWDQQLLGIPEVERREYGPHPRPMTNTVNVSEEEKKATEQQTEAKRHRLRPEPGFNS